MCRKCGHNLTPGGKDADAETANPSVAKRLIRRLDAAHAELVKARKIAALSKHESYEEIGDAIECVEAAFVWLHKSSATRAHEPS